MREQEQVREQEREQELEREQEQELEREWERVSKYRHTVVKSRRDANEAEICGYLDDLHIPWWTLSDAGIPDLLILHKGDWKLLEVKTDLGRLTPPQVLFFECARDWKVKHLYVVRDFDSLMEALKQ